MPKPEQMVMPNRFKKIAVCVAISAVMGASIDASAASKATSSHVSRQTNTQATPARATTARKTTPAMAPTSTSSAAAARARSAAAVRARQLRDVQTPRFRVDEYGREVPDVRAEAAIIYNPQTNEVLWETHSQDQRSIASITKVMTALVFLDSATDLATPVTVARTDVANASTTYIRAGYKITAEDLLNLLLVGSDNAAARALARVSPYGSDVFIEKMNEKAATLGLTNTHYADPSGLLAENVSSAFDLARLIAYAAADERIGAIMRKSSYQTYSGKTLISAHSTNQIVRSGDIDVVGGKTGFINRSGYCLVTLLRLPDTGQQVAFVVLGAKSNAGRFWETRHLFNWMSSRSKSAADGTSNEQ